MQYHLPLCNTKHHARSYPDWDEIGKRRQQQVDKKNNARENKKRVPYDYIVGNKFLKINEVNGERANE